MAEPAPLRQETVSALLLRIERAEQDIKDVKAQLGLYTPTRENDLQIQSISDTVHRIEADVARVKERLTGMTEAMVKTEQDVRQRDAEQKQSAAQLQIRVLWFVVSTIITIAVIIFTGYITHLFR